MFGFKRRQREIFDEFQKMNRYLVSNNEILEKLQENLVDFQYIQKKLEKDLDCVESNLKSFNSMVLELKGCVAMVRAMLPKPLKED
jgi:hypothetical protein